MTVVNSGAAADRVIALSTPAAQRAEMHIEVHEGGVVQMRPVSAVDVESGQQLVFKPNGLHIIRLVRPPHSGDRLPITVTFEKAGRITAEVQVLPVGAQAYP
jgi:copper(I)-binding protein